MGNSQKNRCNMCHMKKKSFEIDHIVPLSQNGTNERKNLQALCKKCHTMKTEKQEMDKYFKCDYIKSFYNSLTKEIFSIKRNGHIWGYQCGDASKYVCFSEYDWPVYTS